jgi:tetratricopeptide (TPR) repeat protein
LEAQPRLWQTVRDLDSSGRQARLLLEPLSAAETGELVRRLLPEGSGANLVARLHAATGGNPLFMLETLRAIHERQVTEALKPATGLHALDAEDLPVSATVYELIAQRVAALPGESRHTAHALAVSGSGLDIDALTEVCELPRAQMLDAVDHLVSAGMITAAAGRYALAHDQLTEVTYDAMPAPERSLLHIGLARALEGAGSTDAETLGHHFRLGGAPTEATRYLEAAAREAARLSAFAAARDRYWEALAQAEAAGWSPAEQARLRLAQEQILEVLGEQQGRHRLLDELAVPAGADAALKAEVTQRRAWLLASVSQLAAAAETATAALDLHTSLGDSVGCARDLEALGTIAMWGSRNQEAVEWLESALVLAPDGSTLEAAIRNSLGDVLGHLHRFTEAEEQLGQARALFERHGDRRGLASILSSLAVVHGQRGDGDLAERTLLEAANLCEEIGYRYGMAINALNLGHHHFIAGQIARALPPADRARTVFQTLDNPRGLAMATANLASLHHAVGHDETAERLSCEALAIFDSLHHGAGAALCHGTLAEIARRRGDGPGAERELALGLSKATGLEATNARLQLLRTQSHLRLDAGDIEDGLRIAEQARRECLAASAGWLVSDLSVPLARALVLYGEPGRALEVTRSAGGVAEEPALLHWRMRALEAVGDHTGAQVTLESAHRAMLRQLDGFSPEEIAHTLAVVPQFRRVDELWAARRPRRLVVRLAAANAPTGRPVGDEDLIEVTWTIQHPLDEVHRPGPEMRATQLLRLMAEAEAAGAVPTIGDLAGALGVSSATVRRDLDALRRSGHAIRTRGRRR